MEKPINNKSSDSEQHAQACLATAEEVGDSPLRNTADSGIPVDEGTSPPPRCKRDSGYLTDNSPAAPSIVSKTFTFDDEEHLAGAVGGMDPRSRSLSEFGDFSGLLLENEEEEGDDSPFGDESDNASDEKEESNDEANEQNSGLVRTNQVLFKRQASLPMAVPLSPPIAQIAQRSGVRSPFLLSGEFLVRTQSRRATAVIDVSTQTPHVLSQMMHHVISDPMLTLQVRGTAVSTLRHYSESDDVSTLSHPHGPLPDIVPHTRDRSISLPDMQALRNQREVEVGRELRRLSDEFNENYRSRPRRRSMTSVDMIPSNSFPGAHGHYFSGFVDTFRSIFLRSPSPLDERDDPS